MNPRADDVQFFDLGEQVRRDGRGISFFPFQAAGRPPEAAAALESFHLVSVLPGQARGHHRHPQKTEWLYLFAGTGLFTWEDREGRLRERRLAGDATLVVIAPDTPHALRNDGEQTIFLLAWRLAAAGSGEPDTVPWNAG